MKTWVMPKLELQGSDKQIKWATEIISDIYSTANINVSLAHENRWPNAEKFEEAFDQIITQLEGFLSRVDQAGVIITYRERFDSGKILNLANKYVNREALK